MTQTPTDEQLLEIGLAVYEMAESHFVEARATDFCIQAIGQNVVFGGTNRLILNRSGWYADSGYCNESFMQSVEKLSTSRYC